MKSMYKIDRRGGSKNRILGNYRWLCTKLIERGEFQKLFTLTDQCMHIIIGIEIVTIFCLVGHKIKN